MVDRGARVPRQAPQLFSANQLQQMVDHGTITPAVMADQLAWQHARAGLMQMRAETVLREAAQTVAAKQRAAKEEVDKYIERVPDLRDRSSKTMERVTKAAHEIAQELGVPITDPLVQRSALRQELGRLDALDKAAEPKPTPATPASELDRLIVEKGITQSHIEWWDRANYSPKRRLQEARDFIPRSQRRRLG